MLSPLCLLQTAAQLLAAHKNLRFRPSSALLEALAVHVETDACLGAPRSLAVIIWGLGGLDHRPSNLGAYQDVSRGRWAGTLHAACAASADCTLSNVIQAGTDSAAVNMLLHRSAPIPGVQPACCWLQWTGSQLDCTRHTCPSPAHPKHRPVLGHQVQHQQQSTFDACR